MFIFTTRAALNPEYVDFIQIGNGSARVRLANAKTVLLAGEDVETVKRLLHTGRFTEIESSLVNLGRVMCVENFEGRPRIVFEQPANILAVATDEGAQQLRAAMKDGLSDLPASEAVEPKPLRKKKG
jgi:diadenosine tetraphosphatase ApaH/serine/threonine PP2A family protein phosphatase